MHWLGDFVLQTHADATAITDCALFVIERQDFLPVVREEPEIAIKLIEILCARLRRTTEQAREVMFLDLPSRLAKALMRLVDADIAGIRECKISITQKDLGNIIGMSRESTNKQLRIWEDKKWVRLERNAVVILAMDHIAAIAEDRQPANVVGMNASADGKLRRDPTHVQAVGKWHTEPLGHPCLRRVFREYPRGRARP